MKAEEKIVKTAVDVAKIPVVQPKPVPVAPPIEEPATEQAAAQPDTPTE